MRYTTCLCVLPSLGVEILCVMGQAADGCRYLQASGLWEEALLLARCSLTDDAAAAVIGKHADHLLTVGREVRRYSSLLPIDGSSMGQRTPIVGVHKRVGSVDRLKNAVAVVWVGQMAMLIVGV